MNGSKAYPGFWHAVLLCVVFLGAQTTLSMPVYGIDLALKTRLVTHPLVLAGISMGAWALAMVLASAIGRQPLREVAPLKPVAFRLYLPMLCGGAGTVILLSEADNLLRTVLPPPDWLVQIFREMSPSSDHPWAGFFLLVIVAPVTEEILFRGLVLRGFLRRYRPGTAIIVSSLLFGAVHMNPWQFVSATGLGLLLAWWYARTLSLLPCLLGHALANGTVYGAEFLPFEINGFNAGDPFTSSGFHPWWFDATGVLLFAVGIWLFHRLAPAVPPCIKPPESGVPPIIPPPDAAHHIAQQPFSSHCCDPR